MALAGAAVLYGGDVANDLVFISALILLERHFGIGVVDPLELGRVRLYLLSEVLDALGDVFCDAEVMLNPLHGGTGLGLLQGVGGESLVCVHKLLHLLLFEVDSGLFPVIIRHFFVIIVVSGLLVLLYLVNRRLLDLRCVDAGYGRGLSDIRAIVRQLAEVGQLLWAEIQFLKVCRRVSGCLLLDRRGFRVHFYDLDSLVSDWWLRFQRSWCLNGRHVGQLAQLLHLWQDTR